MLTQRRRRKTLTAEFLLASARRSSASCCPTCRTCEKLGIKASVRIVDSAQYQRRDDTLRLRHHRRQLRPVASRPATSSATSGARPPPTRDGSRNIIGIKNPAIDKLIDKIIFAKDRAELVAATHALDRVLLWNYYVVPQWHYPFERIAYWDMFGRPATLPSQTSALRRRSGGSTPPSSKALGGATRTMSGWGSQAMRRRIPRHGRAPRLATLALAAALACSAVAAPSRATASRSSAI